MIHSNYYSLGFVPIKHNEKGNDIHKEEFKKIPHFIKNHHRVNCIHDGSVLYNDNLLIQKWEVIAPIPDSMIPVDFQNKKYVINLTTDDMVSKF